MESAVFANSIHPAILFHTQTKIETRPYDKKLTVALSYFALVDTRPETNHRPLHPGSH